jgi:Zn-dependent protease with chaperone function/membrane associated rhomboid family serine protease
MAISAPVVLSRPSPAYYLALAAVALVAVLIPLAYLSLVGLITWGVYLYAVHAGGWLTTVSFVGAALYLSPLVAGVTLVAFTLKPFLARRPAPPAPFSLAREQEPRLAAFVDELCRLVDAPRPARIDVDVSANAGAGLQGHPLRGGGLVVSFGLPVAATLDAQRFAAVLVHELAHCRQGVALRLHRLVVAINTWLARVVYERDDWDEALSRGVRVGPHGALLLAPALLCVAVTRVVLHWLMLAGHAVRARSSRRMEIEADRSSALVVGSEAAAATLRLLQGLEVAVGRTDAELQSLRSSDTVRAPDDVVDCVGVFFGALRPEDWRRIDDHMASLATAPFDTHPAAGARLESFRRMHVPGVLQATGPARALFTDFGAVSRALTLHAYKSAFSAPVELVSVPEFTEGLRAAVRSRAAMESFFGGDSSVALETLCPSGERHPGERAHAQAELDAALEDMARLRSGARDATARFEALFLQYGRLLAARQACEVDASFEAEALGLNRDDVAAATRLADAVEQALARNAEERRLVSADIEPFRRAATRAVTAALARLDAPEIDIAAGVDQAVRAETDLLVAALNAFSPNRTRWQEAAANLCAFGVFVSATRPPDSAAAEAGNRALTLLMERAWDLLAPLREVLRELAVTAETVRDPRVVDCHRAILAVEPHARHVFELAQHVGTFHDACSSRLLQLLGLAGAAGESDAEPVVGQPAGARTRSATAGPESGRAPVSAPLTVEPRRLDFSRALALRTPTLIATPALVILAILLFTSRAVSLGASVSPTPDMILRAGAAFRPLVVAGEWWRLLAAPLLGDGLLPVAVSIVALVLVGRIAERVFGTAAFLTWFLVIGAGTALAGVLLSETGLFVTLAPAVLGVGVAAGAVSAELTTSARPHDIEETVPPLEFPGVTKAVILVTLGLQLALTGLGSANGMLLQVLAVAMGLLLARTTAADAPFRKPAGRRIAAAALVAAAVLGIALAHLRSRPDFRSEGFGLLATEERALDSFGKTLRHARWRGPAVAEELEPIVQQALTACAGAQARADRMTTRYQAEVARDAQLDRYGRISNWRAWVAARDQLAMGAAYREYLRSREGVWQTRLRYVRQGQLDALGHLDLADAQARTALREGLARRELALGP